MAAEQRLCQGTLTSRTPLGKNISEPSLPQSSDFDYNILLLKRSGKSKFMPNAFVFPGGQVDSSDFSSEWLDLFRSLSNIPSFGLRRVKQPAETRPPVFAIDRLKLGSPIPGEVAFRICALRETFEESGVLLVVPKAEETRLLRLSTFEASLSAMNDICPKELKKWRSLVNQCPSNFIKMCRELQVLPNIWALHEWSNWLTPVSRPGNRRFDTAFFICCLKEIPNAHQDKKEIELYQWTTPSAVLQSFEDQEVWLPPPQFYELSRLCRYPSFVELHRFASERATEGCERWMPVISVEGAQNVLLLPGDERYPGTVSEDPAVESKTDRERESVLHRMMLVNSYKIEVQMNVTPKYKHLMPAQVKSKNQL